MLKNVVHSAMAGLNAAMVRFTRKQTENIERYRLEGTCEICGSKDRRKLARDHHHGSNRYRGILCDRCNKVLGFIKDDPTIAESMAAYLRRPPIVYNDEMTPVFSEDDY